MATVFSVEQVVSLAGDDPMNEDVAGWTAGAAWVIDGATPLGEPYTAGPLTSAAWFAQRLSAQFAALSAGPPGAASLIRTAQDRLATESRAAGLGGTRYPPSASAAYLAARDGQVEVAVVGDVEALAVRRTGQAELVSNHLPARLVPGPDGDLVRWGDIADQHEQRQVTLHDPAGAHVLESEYAKTDWGLYRSTLAEPPGHNFLPLDFGYAGEPVTAGTMTGSLDRIFLSPRGALCFVHESRHTDPGGWHPVVQVIRDHRRIFQLSRSSVEAGLDAFTRLWADAGLPGKLARPTATSWWPYVQIYELADIDMGLRTGHRVTTPVEDIKRLYRPPASIPGMDLVALTRMSEAAATDHKNTRVDELQAADIGYRSDELWAVTGERLVRCFPGRDDWTEIAFFEDVMIAAAVLLQQRVARDSMALWASSRRSAQYQQASSGAAARASSGTFAEDIRKVLAASAVISEPSLLFIGTRNTFYGLVVAQLVRLLGVEERRRSALESVQQFAAFSETMSNYRSQETQLSLSRAAGRLGWISVLLAVVALVIGAIQVYVAVFP